MQLALLGKRGSVAAPQLQGRTARACPINSLVNTMEVTAAIQYIWTAAQSLGSQDYYKKSPYLGLLVYYSAKRTGIDEIDYCMFRRKYLLGCLGKLGEASKQQFVIEYNQTNTLATQFFVLFCFFQQSVVFP